MQANSPSILPIPPEVAAQIRSSTTISTLTCVVLGLLVNSLDADAHRINISVDFGRGSVSVEDDGFGIPPREFTEAGGLGKPYCGQRVVLRKGLTDSKQIRLRTPVPLPPMGRMGYFWPLWLHYQS